MADYTLSVNIKGDSEEFKKALKTAQNAVDGFEKKTQSMSAKLDKIGGKMQSIGAKLSVGVTLPLGAAAKASISAASDFDENLNKVDVAFGNSARAVEAWSETATKQFGLSMNQALEATSLFGDMATSMGLTQPAAAEMSMSLAGLAGDMASFKNVSIEQAMTALNGVFTGETESLKQLGIVMTETNLDEFAAQTGQVYSAMSQAEKVQLRYNYVMAMTKNAQGDYARTADGTANSLRTFQGTVDNLAVAFGQNLLPTITPLVQKATDLVNEFATLSPSTQQNIVQAGLFAAALGPIASLAGTVAKGLSTISTAAGGMKSAGEQLINFGKNVSVVKKSFSGMSGPLTAEQQKIANFAKSVSASFQGVGKQAAALKGSVSGAFSGLGTSLSGVGAKLSSGLGSLGTSLMSMGGAMKVAIAPFLPAVAIIGAVAAALVLLFNTNEEFRNSCLTMFAEIQAAFAPLATVFTNMISQIAAALMPAIQSLGAAFTQLMTALTPLITLLAGIFAETITIIAGVIVQIVQAVMPLVATLISQLAPVLTTIVTALTPIISTIASALIPIIQTIVSILTTYVIPIITKIITVVANVITKVMEIVTPIITFIAEVIGKIISTIAKIIEKVADIFGKVKDTIVTVWNAVKSFISGVISKIASVINAIITPVKNTFNKVKSIVLNVFDKVQGAWNGFKGFVGGVVDGIRGAFDDVVNFFKSIVNAVIKGINGAIGLINKIPGVEISKIAYLAHGTDNWQGGFAVMNEGGRGELVNLPNGSQVIPHDISVKYAKESAKANAAAEVLDTRGLSEGIAAALMNGLSGAEIRNVLTLDGDVLANKLTPLIDRRLARITAMKARGI